MIVMFTMTYPTTSAVEFGKAVMKNFQEHPLPGFIKLIGPYTQIYEHGCKSISILEIELGKEDVAHKIFNKRMANYLRVPGFGSKEEIFMNMEESLSLIGLEVP